MPDFDPKDIPVLDDIVDDESADTNGLDNAENENNLALFEENEAETAAEAESPIDTTDNHIDPNAIHEKISQLSIQHDYEEIYSGLAFRLDAPVKKDQQENNTQDETNSLTTIEPLALESIIESVVKQMMPDLEQQLRFLIQRSLEEKLPADILKASNSKPTDS